jgi:hypothetical protein
MLVPGDKSNPLAPESFKAYCKASIESFSLNVTTLTPALIAPNYNQEERLIIGYSGSK